MGLLYLLEQVTFHYHTLGIAASRGELTTAIQLFLLPSCNYKQALHYKHCYKESIKSSHVITVT